MNTAPQIRSFLITTAFVLSIVRVNGQILYVPGGTGGIGTSTQNGNVGIATNSPLSVFHVSAGSARALIEVNSSSVLSPLNLWNSNTGSNAGAGLLITAGASPTAGFIGGVASQRIDAGSNSRTAFRVLSNGALSGTDSSAIFYLEGNAAGPRIVANANVGIGTSNPTQKLSVNGTIRAKEVIVEASPWPDDVFAPGYQLPSADELAQRIQSEGHLPDVPSAAAVGEHGVAVGEMQKTLLRKVEELTLYMLAQEQRLRVQESRIRELEAQLDRADSAFLRN